MIHDSILKEFDNHQFPHHVDIESIKTFVSVSPSVVAFKNEVEEKFIIEASKTIMVLSYLMTEFATSNAPFSEMEMPELDTNFSFARLEGIVRKIVIDFASHTKLEPKDRCDHEASREEIFDDGESEKNLDSNFSEVLAKELSNLLSVSSRAIYISKPVKDLSSFMIELRKPGEVPELKEFDEEDIKLKRALADCNHRFEQKKQEHLVLQEFVLTLHSIIQSVDVIKVALKYGYPLPIIAFEKLLPILSKLLQTNLNIKVFSNDLLLKGKINFEKKNDKQIRNSIS